MAAPGIASRPKARMLKQSLTRKRPVFRAFFMRGPGAMQSKFSGR